ncbi:AlpA family transcriptional regulator [Demequina sp. NBRC 110051]|uniref:helix-turn-helix transcriptional regulator n=1 Tax=Demequina sp. NBRC 110051 TaxID=1570340 RepID=UPI000A0365BB|nr:helix-turn-helix domain-containing protein [Demequina sp. NBRC 110051]
MRGQPRCPPRLCGDDPVPDLLTVDELATLLRKSRSSIYDMRAQGRGPRALREGKRVLYRRSDVEQWLEAHFEGTPD